jgi:hypothetical protein
MLIRIKTSVVSLPISIELKPAFLANALTFAAEIRRSRSGPISWVIRFPKQNHHMMWRFT